MSGYQQQQHVVPHAAEGGGLTLAKFVGGVRAHPRLASFVVLWILLALSFVYAPAPVVVTPAMQRQFEETLAKVPMRQIHAATLERDEAADYVGEAKVWFWRFRPEYASEVERRQPELDRAQARLDKLLAEKDAIMLEARQVVGIWSEYGIEEARDKFWANMQAGKDVAKRATMWDMMFSAFSMRRDESLASFLLGLVVKLVFNLTFGLIIMLIAFLFSLGSFVWSFGPGFVNGTLFFTVAALGASAVVFGIITLLFGGLGGGLYVIAKAAANPNRRIGGGAGGGYPRAYLHQQQQQQRHYRAD